MPRVPAINPFRNYADRVVGRFRFGQDQITRDFIKFVLDSAGPRERHVEAGEKYWRAQLGPDDIVRDGKGDWDHDSIRPHDAKRMTPCSRFVGNGRANPVGIPYWYGATDPETAVAEMRPWKEAILTVATLQATRDLRFVDCGNTRSVVLDNSGMDSRYEQYVWDLISEALSRPVAPTTIDVEYVPTQMLAEAFRIRGFDGILYKSHLGKGVNVVVFDLSALAIGGRELWTADDVSYVLKPHGDEITID